MRSTGSANSVSSTRWDKHNPLSYEKYLELIFALRTVHYANF